ncbi:class I SAM-dependent methyltransferase [uncultured Mycobacterium sp.]|uniref:class I SAM-dependent methyltransferase n=1 Tax=uncultured Mycobacterium sp. TaxID=171292 RepID=UPI0035C995A6
MAYRPIIFVRNHIRRNVSRKWLQRKVSHHHNLSNGLFEFLDEAMTYSSGLFTALPASWDDLAGVQRRKIDRLLDAAGVGPGTHVLEIGTGWGDLCIRAAGREPHNDNSRPRRESVKALFDAINDDRVVLAACALIEAGVNCPASCERPAGPCTS